MTDLTRLYAMFIVLMILAGCSRAGHEHPVYWHEHDDRYHNPHQHWSRGPHTDH